MTRENKLALVIGFGLILFIGILISDHFSLANNQATADLTQPQANGRTIARADRPLELLVPEIFPEREEPASAILPSAPGQMTPPAGVAGPGMNEIRTPDLLATNQSGSLEPRRMQTNTAPAQSMPVQSRRDYPKHHLADKETLTAVAVEHYGSAKLVGPLATFNGIADPDKVRAGHRLEIPPLDVLVAETGYDGVLQIAQDTPRQDIATPRYQDYEIQRGDILSKLASRFMGTGNRWKELYELNKDVIENPDKLKEGTVIRVPAS